MNNVFLKRVSAPASSDKHWVHTIYGGMNSCILVKDKSVLPNCVGYAWGRWAELLGKQPSLSRSNAENWFGTNDGYARGKTPKLGAVVCWQKGATLSGKDGAGHVAIVEDILADGSIITSNSGYLSTLFYMRTIKPPYEVGGLYKFQGFIYPPVEFVKKTEVLKDVETIAKEVILGDWGNGADRKAKLKAKGYDYAEVQKAVEYILAHPKTINYKTVDVIAQEVIDGKWGTGTERKAKLVTAEYNYVAVQEKVNILLSTNNKTKKPDTEIAKEVIAGKWGNGVDRKNALEKAGYNYTNIQKIVSNIFKR
jgi:hypothetical protein